MAKAAIRDALRDGCWKSRSVLISAVINSVAPEWLTRFHIVYSNTRKGRSRQVNITIEDMINKGASHAVSKSLWELELHRHIEREWVDKSKKGTGRRGNSGSDVYCCRMTEKGLAYCNKLVESGKSMATQGSPP